MVKISHLIFLQQHAQKIAFKDLIGHRQCACIIIAFLLTAEIAEFIRMIHGF